MGEVNYLGSIDVPTITALNQSPERSRGTDPYPLLAGVSQRSGDSSTNDAGSVDMFPGRHLAGDRVGSLVKFATGQKGLFKSRNYPAIPRSKKIASLFFFLPKLAISVLLNKIIIANTNSKMQSLGRSQKLSGESRPAKGRSLPVARPGFSVAFDPHIWRQDLVGA
jgi:hypothetical protein